MTDSPGVVAGYLRDVHARHAAVGDGALADYVPELALVEPDRFGLALATADGAVHEAGDSRHRFTMQSVCKPLSYALALADLGLDAVSARVGVEPTGDAFNAISLDADGRATNPMVNAGAIAVAGLLVEAHGDAALDRLLAGYAALAGRPLEVDAAVHASELATAHRNRAIAHLLRGSGALACDPEAALDLYLSACAVAVDARDLAVVAATLAGGGINPLTGEQVLPAVVVRHVVAVMTTCGMYDSAGAWMVDVGLPAKSGVGGGILAVAPGTLGLAAFSPRLDPVGTSVRGGLALRDLARELDLGLVPEHVRRAAPVRALRTLDRQRSTRPRTPDQDAAITAHGASVLVVELQGTMDFAAAEQVVRALETHPDRAAVRDVVVDARRVAQVPDAVRRLLLAVAQRLGESGGTVVVAREDLDDALARAEEQVLARHAR